jgi:hypothetical protein
LIKKLADNQDDFAIVLLKKSVLETAMRLALHAETEQKVTPEQFIAREGMRYKERGVFPLCASCKRPVIVYGVSSPNVRSRFQHAKNSPNCPLRYRDDPRFIDLPQSERSDYEAREKRKAFYDLDSLKGAYVVCWKMCGAGNLPAKKFGELLDLADKKHIWEYVELEIPIVPYILVTLDDFAAKRKDKQPYSFRFVLIKEHSGNIGGDIGYMCANPRECSLNKIFCDTGKIIKTFNIPYPECEEARNNAGWINQCESLLTELKKLSLEA